MIGFQQHIKKKIEISYFSLDKIEEICLYLKKNINK